MGCSAPLLTYGTVQGTGVNTYNIRAADSDGEGYGIGDARGEYSVDLQTHRYEPSRVASGFYCTIGGGADNTASVYASTVSGGYRNKAINIHSTVSGGNDNVASGDSSTVSGGQKNEATGDHSTVSGGWLNTASGDYSWAGGKFAKTGANNNTFAWSDGYGSIDLAAIPIPNAANQFAIIKQLVD